MTQVDTSATQERLVSATSSAHAKAAELAKHVVRMTTAAGSGHPSTALALSHIIVELMYRQMRFDPADPWSPTNDRLVLSIGHGVPIVYAAYADLGGVVGCDRNDARPLTVGDLTTLRELDSVLDGHPNPAEGFPFFDAATGSLGQGLSVAAGLALAARLDGIDKRIFVVAGDGEAREGQIWEALDFVVDHKLSNICMIFSCNGHGQADAVSTQQSADAISAKVRAFGWTAIEVDGHDPAELADALDRAGQGDKPTAVVARTIKGWGIDSIQKENFHGKPIPAAKLQDACDELDATCKRLGGDTADAAEVAKRRIPRRVSVGTDASSRERRKHGQPVVIPPFAEALGRVGLGAALTDKKLATRAAYGAALVALGDADERIVALDGDVSNSTLSNLFAARHPNRFFECKIAEQNMITAGAGLAAAGRIPFASSFAKFIARAVDQIDMALISRANLKIVGSHAGVSLGADGPSQMAVADVAYFRSMTRAKLADGRPACHLFHPSDPILAYHCCRRMADINGLCYLRTHRPAADFLYPLDKQFALGGCERIREGDRLTLLGSGYLLHTVIKAAEMLADDGIECNVFDVFQFPLDSQPILAATRKSGGVILTVEDNYLGGLHAELAEAAAQANDVRVMGMTAQRIPKSARSAAEVFTYVGVGLEQIVETARKLAQS